MKDWGVKAKFAEEIIKILLEIRPMTTKEIHTYVNKIFDAVKKVFTDVTA